MKIVNEKGKLFGIINVIDLVVILVIAIVAVAAVYKFAAPAAGDVIAPKSDMTVTMRVRGAMDYLEAEVTKLPSTYVTLSTDDDIKYMNLLLEYLDDDDDVTDVYHNWEN